MKVEYGPLIGRASGSLGATTASHNRYGTYFRLRATPVTSTTVFALATKAHLADASTHWDDLTDAQRLQWFAFARENPIIDSLGAKRILAGNAMFVALNSRILRDGGTIIDSPPVTENPEVLHTLTLSLDIGAGSFEAAFTPTPLAAGIKLWLSVAVVNSPGINFVQNLLKQVSITAAAQASPFDFQADTEARFGTLLVGQKVVVMGHAYDSTSGQLSVPLRAEGLVVTT